MSYGGEMFVIFIHSSLFLDLDHRMGGRLCIICTKLNVIGGYYLEPGNLLI